MSIGDPLYVGLMSGTSLDAIDTALVQCGRDRVTLLATHEHVIPPETKSRIAALSHSGPDEIERMGALDRELGILFAKATLHLLDLTDRQPQEIRAIGSHGQTVRHRPPSAGHAVSFTLQIGDPNTIAELTGITTVADFRRRDIAAGGEGAPLAPAFHAAALSKPGVNRFVVNIGGIANVSVLEGNALRMGFDSGPGNTLLDHWIASQRDKPFDRNGEWSATGRLNLTLLEKLLTHPFFRKEGPRSTGKEDFNLAWLEEHLAECGRIAAADVQATLLELTCTSIVRAIHGCPVEAREIYVCGGGSHNAHLMARLAQKLAPATVASTAAIGIDPDWVEAATFAWLAGRTLDGLAGNSPDVTGAAGARVLGAVYPGGVCV